MTVRHERAQPHSEHNAAYQEQFGWRLIVAVKGPSGNGRGQQGRVDALERRLRASHTHELQECLRQIHRIAELRLNHRCKAQPTLGEEVWDWHEWLAQFSDEGFAERGELSVSYLTPAHLACSQTLKLGMQACGFDEVAIDAVGNVVGRYHPAHSGGKYLLSGSHYDTVRNGGKYDGRLGFFVPMACVRELARAKRRLSVGIEVVAFAEEEGVRYKATFLASAALTGHFQNAWLEQTDKDGISMRQAMQHAGLNPQDIPALKRDASRYVGFIEVHIEQGPVLHGLNIPLGIVTSINGSRRYLGEILGTASHAGTTPMGQRQDAAAALAEWSVYLEQRATLDGDSVATIGMLNVPNGSVNVVPGRCSFSLDMRAPTDAQRDALAEDVLQSLARICQARGLRFSHEETVRAAAAPIAPPLQQAGYLAVSSLGNPLLTMPIGARHGASQYHTLIRQERAYCLGEK